MIHFAELGELRLRCLSKIVCKFEGSCPRKGLRNIQCKSQGVKNVSIDSFASVFYQFRL